jgi:hypothetical protein
MTNLSPRHADSVDAFLNGYIWRFRFTMLRLSLTANGLPPPPCGLLLIRWCRKTLITGMAELVNMGLGVKLGKTNAMLTSAKHS